MSRATPLWMLLCFGAVFPVSCSNDDGGEGTKATGGSNADITLGDGDGDSGDGDSGDGDSGDGDGDKDASASKCAEFVGLEECGSDAVIATRNPVNILLVLDKSGSMAEPPDPDSTTSLWEATTTALKAAILDANENVAFGLHTYPKKMNINCAGAECCEMPGDDESTVAIASDEDNRQAILTELDRTSPGGGTPTTEALARAYNYFNSGEGSELKGDRFVLLATDGGPNCNNSVECGSDQCTYNIIDDCDLPDDNDGNPGNCCDGSPLGCLDDQNALDQIKLLRKIGVDTFVVGLAGSEQYSAQLDSFADAGGREREDGEEKYFKVGGKGSKEGLEKVLNKITRDLVQSCNVQLATPPVDPNKVNVAVDCDIVKRGNAPEEDGQGGEASQSDIPSTWDLDTSTSPPTVRLRGAICDEIESAGVERVDIIHGCRTVR